MAIKYVSCIYSKSHKCFFFLLLKQIEFLHHQKDGYLLYNEKIEEPYSTSHMCATKGIHLLCAAYLQTSHRYPCGEATPQMNI